MFCVLVHHRGHRGHGGQYGQSGQEPAIARAVTKAVQETIFDQNKDRIDVATAAKILNVSKKTIYRYCKEGPEETRLHYTQADGKIQLLRTEVENYSRKQHAIRIKPFGRK